MSRLTATPVEMLYCDTWSTPEEEMLAPQASHLLAREAGRQPALYSPSLHGSVLPFKVRKPGGVTATEHQKADRVSSES